MKHELAPHVQLLATTLAPEAGVALARLRLEAVQIKRYDSLTGASPSLEEIHLPGGFVVGIVDPGKGAR